MLKVNTVLAEKQAFILRFAVGLVFGLILGWLTYTAHDAHYVPPAQWKIILFMTLGLSAFIWWAAAAAMRRVSLAVWGLAVSAVIAFIAWHQSSVAANPGFFFSDPVAALLIPLLFIAHNLAASADQAGRPIAPYATYFEEAWKRGVQLALALVFTGLFWGILWLGAALLKFIGFVWLETLLQNSFFSWAASGAAMACAVQLGDVQTKLLTGVRALVLGVMSWLLPVIAVIGLIFLASLAVSGLAPLWKTGAATVTLLGGCGAFVLLINAAYQQGDQERKVYAVMAWTARLGGLLLLAFALLAAYSLWLRIAQYGLTTERVLALTGVIIAVLFGVGYAVAALVPGRWLRLIEAVNIAMAFVACLLFLALLTPPADPTRLSVADQVARLNAGRVSVTAFDWKQLRFDSGKYGTDALTSLTTSGKTPDIRAAAAKAKALNDEQRYENNVVAAVRPDLTKIEVVSPAGGKLPASFLMQDFSSAKDACLNDVTQAPCTAAALIDMDGDGEPEVLILKDFSLGTYRETAKGWENGSDPVYLDEDQVKAFEAGQITTAPHIYRNVVLAGKAETLVPPKGGSIASSEKRVRAKAK